MIMPDDSNHELNPEGSLEDYAIVIGNAVFEITRESHHNLLEALGVLEMVKTYIIEAFENV